MPPLAPEAIGATPEAAVPNEGPRPASYDAPMTALMETFWTASNRGDVDTMISLVTDDVVYQDMVRELRIEGREAFRVFLCDVADHLPIDNFTVSLLGSTAERCSAEWTSHATGARGVTVGELRDGLMCAVRDYYVTA